MCLCKIAMLDKSDKYPTRGKKAYFSGLFFLLDKKNNFYQLSISLSLNLWSCKESIICISENI